MSNYPALLAMGVQNPEQIARYSVFMSNKTDILRLVYNRKKGSLLPVTRKYRFPQLKKSTLVDSGTRQTALVYESSAEFRNAILELERLMDSHASTDQVTNLITEEIASLEEDVSARVAYIKELLAKL